LDTIYINQSSSKHTQLASLCFTFYHLFDLQNAFLGEKMSKHDQKSDNDISNMAGIKTAIVNGEEHRLQQLLAGIHLDELNKSYLLDLAKMNNNQQVISIIENTPVKP